MARLPKDVDGVWRATKLPAETHATAVTMATRAINATTSPRRH